MNKLTAFILCLTALTLADTFTFQISGASNSTGNLTVEDWQIGYGAQEINGNGGDDLEIATVIGLILISGVFFYQHRNANNPTWSKIWLLIAMIISCTAILAIRGYAETEGQTTIASVALVLFNIMFWTFFILLLLFIWGGILNFVRFVYRVIMKREPKW